MRIGDLSLHDLQRELTAGRLAVRTGPFGFRLRCNLPAVAQGIALLYADHPRLGDDDFCDFTLEVGRVRGLRRWIRPQVQALYDGEPNFEPLPLGHAFPLLEWTLNWCLSTHTFEYLTLHAAVVERGGRAAILPAPPGSGKSTLCAALVHRGWRLLSDEMALVALDDGRVWPLARPVSLKNASIDVIRRFAPDAVLSEPTHDTIKGTVVHMKVPAEQVLRMDETAAPAWIVFPRYVAGAPARLVERPKADAMIELGQNSFNYGVLGRAGFDALADLVTGCDCADFSYGDLDEAIAVFDQLASGAPT